jgi:hypothetical protein
LSRQIKEPNPLRARLEVVVLLGLVAALITLLLAIVVFAVAGQSRASRVLGGLLVTEGIFRGAFSISDLDDGVVGEWFVVLAFAGGLALCALYPWLLRELASPYTRWFRSRRFMVVWTTLFIADAIFLVVANAPILLRGEELPEDSWQGFLAVPAFIVIFFLSILALLAAVYAFRHADAGPSKERARAFMLAFGVRDVAYVLAIAANFASDLFPGPFRAELLIASDALGSVAILLFVPLLAYGILRTQLFDIDLKIKLGIKRGTVVGIILGAFFAAAKITESYLSREVGFVAGSIIAGLMLFVVPKLNKLGDKVANTAMPTVQATPVYVQFKKLEVYRAAVESAHETGGITEKERASLDRLRTKLGILEPDASALESEILSSKVGTA